MRRLAIVLCVAAGLILISCQGDNLTLVHKSEASFKLYNYLFDQTSSYKNIAPVKESMRGIYISKNDLTEKQRDSVFISKSVTYSALHDSTLGNWESLQIGFVRKEARKNLIFMDEQRVLYRHQPDLIDLFFLDQNTEPSVTYYQNYLSADAHNLSEVLQEFDIISAIYLRDDPSGNAYLTGKIDTDLTNQWMSVDSTVFNIKGTFSAVFHDTLYIYNDY